MGPTMAFPAYAWQLLVLFSRSWSIYCGKIEFNPGDFPGSRWLRAVGSCSDVEGPETLWSSGVGTFHRSDTSLMSLVDSRSPSCVRHSSQVAKRWSLPRWGTDERSVRNCQ